MPVIALGLNHKTAPVAVREQLAFAAADVPAALQTLAQSVQLGEAAILSTCNRTEIYGADANVAATVKWLLGSVLNIQNIYTPYQATRPCVI